MYEHPPHQETTESAADGQPPMAHARRGTHGFWADNSNKTTDPFEASSSLPPLRLVDRPETVEQPQTTYSAATAATAATDQTALLRRALRQVVGECKQLKQQLDRKLRAQRQARSCRACC